MQFRYSLKPMFHGQYKEMRFPYKQLFLLDFIRQINTTQQWHGFCSIPTKFIGQTPYHLRNSKNNNALQYRNTRSHSPIATFKASGKVLPVTL